MDDGRTRGRIAQPLNPHLVSHSHGDSSNSQNGDISTSLASVNCRFFALGRCQKGSQCRFHHADANESKPSEALIQWRTAQDQQQEPNSGILPVLELNEKVKSIIKELGGAAVEFGDGAAVVNIKIAAATQARLQMSNVNCTWFRPSKSAMLEFTSVTAMNGAKEALTSPNILNRRLDCRTEIDRTERTWKCLIRVRSVDTSTTYGDVKNACGEHWPKNVTFGPPSYSSTPEEIGEAIRKLLASCYPVEAWTLTPRMDSVYATGTAIFAKPEHASKAVKDFDGYMLPHLGGSTVQMSYRVKAKLSILTPMFFAVSKELPNITLGFQPESPLRIKVYYSPNQRDRFTTLHIQSNSTQDISKAKARVEMILRGHTARSAKEIIWHDFFLKSEGLAYLNTLSKKYDVYIFRNAKKRVLSLFGAEEQKALAESKLIQTLEDLAAATHELELDSDLPFSVSQVGYRRIVAKFGKLAARLNMTKTPRTITIQGSKQAFEWAQATLKEASLAPIRPVTEGTEESLCSICYCEMSEPFAMPCGHQYDPECLVSQCALIEHKDIPLKCLGNDGQCNHILSIEALESILTRDQLDDLFERSFLQHVRARPAQYQYCPTAGCDNIYEKSDNSKAFTCPTCVNVICAGCGSVTHEGLTCAQYESAVHDGEDEFAIWKTKNNVKDCPKCGLAIERIDGCNHMHCEACKTHICWKCMAVFNTSDETYDHMTDEHGGVFDFVQDDLPPYDAQQREYARNVDRPNWAPIDDALEGW
ncbi:uncharacterized protein KY384_001283 [Bacidia gigantensis]|uniref:uncharacterized protein n=1 Tax=Bacidia gigantensis TaxID=2732470 RepID=UPI001D039D08|nr:uncharacterized protein KY384_001283 [Bacidia gigantensis]KAG8533543.1 hypothetical protein KY384_001283 [Bacidia gigantensis]